MFPTLTLGSMMFSMTGIGIVLGVMVFLVCLGYYCHKHYLSFVQFYHVMPRYVGCIYLGGSYTSYVGQYHSFFPTSLAEIMIIVLPSQYTFHPVGLACGFGLFVMIFAQMQSSSVMIHKRIDALFVSMMMGICVIGIFLVLGDDVIGLSTDGWMGIYTFAPDSNVAKYNAVIPIGWIYSVIALLSYSIYTRCKTHIPQKIGVGYIGRSFFLLCMSIATMWQIYPRRGVIDGLGIQIDSVNYGLFGCSILFASVFVIIHSLHRKKIARRVLHPVVG